MMSRPMMSVPAEDVMALNDLEYHRLHYLPADHPGRDAWRAARETGWRRMPHDYPSNAVERLGWEQENLHTSKVVDDALESGR
jgi:hypothetical protein